MKRRFHWIPRQFFLVTFTFGFIFAGFFFIWAATLKIPDVASLSERKVSQSSKIYDRTGEILLFDLQENIDKTIIPIEDISRNIQNATVAIEDDRFYDHGGVRPVATFRAVFIQPLRGKGVQGGSTITQQVVKNSILTTERAISRKLKEWIIAIRLEQELSKETILELYLNESPYGGTIYGVEEASQAFFGKPAREVTIAEAAYLAALPQAPTYYSPYGNNRDDLEDRKNLVLSRMHDLSFITKEEYDTAQNEDVVFESQSVSGIRAPHFVFYVREQLEGEYGKRALEESGWRIITTLDMDLQEKGEEVVNRYALQNKEDFNAENGALVAMDPKTGDILTMVGSRDYFDEEIDGNFNIALAERQPGSAFKPFVYAQAFREGYTPDTVVFDLKTQFSTECPPDDLSEDAPCYSPNNYDEVFKGPVTLRSALAESRNVPAVKLLYLVGLQDAVRAARTFGITTLDDINRYGLTLVLGGGEVSLLDMVNAYSTFAAEGIKPERRSILRIEDKNGEVVREYGAQQKRVLEENVALQISDVLSDNDARAPGFGFNSPLNFPGMQVAAKTGTTNDSRDAWIVGYSSNIVAGSWAGNNDNTPTSKNVAGFIVAPMWREFLEYALTKYPNEPFPAYRITINESDKPTLRGIWEGSDIQKDQAVGIVRIPANIHSILFWLDKNNPRGPRPTTPENDSQFMYWETQVRLWAEQNNYTDGTPLFRGI